MHVRIATQTRIFYKLQYAIVDQGLSIQITNLKKNEKVKKICSELRFACTLGKGISSYDGPGKRKTRTNESFLQKLVRSIKRTMEIKTVFRYENYRERERERERDVLVKVGDPYIRCCSHSARWHECVVTRGILDVEQIELPEGAHVLFTSGEVHQNAQRE